MINLNATFLVQLVNIGIVYVVLKRWLLNKVVDDVQQQRKEELEILEEIEVRRKEAAHFEVERERQLEQFQKDVRIELPHTIVDKAHVTLPIASECPSEVSDESVKSLAQKLTRSMYGTDR